ncbi:hypothetical protein C360_04745 [Cryptococcus neoformans Bt15]|nr:hypothetical protein C360_04745 [Cryptococcus neoformans var. grubii Bt15]
MRQFCNGQSLLLMKSNRAKKIRDHQSFAKWMMLGEAGARWKIDDKFKTSLFKQLKRWRTIQESHQKGSATSAKLNRWDIGCTTQSANIFLFRPSGRIPSGMQVYPMVLIIRTLLKPSKKGDRL